MWTRLTEYINIYLYIIYICKSKIRVNIDANMILTKVILFKIYHKLENEKKSTLPFMSTYKTNVKNSSDFHSLDSLIYRQYLHALNKKIAVKI